MENYSQIVESEHVSTRLPAQSEPKLPIAEFYAHLKHCIVNKEQSRKQHDFPTLCRAYNDKFEESNLKMGLVTGVYIFHQLFRLQRHKSRLVNAKATANWLKANGKSLNNVEHFEPTKVDKNGFSSNGNSKLSKFETLPDYIMKSTAPMLKLSALLFALNRYSDSLNRDIVCSLVSLFNEDDSGNFNDELGSVASVVELCLMDSNKMRQWLAAKDAPPLERIPRKLLICGLLEISELLRDRPCAKLAMDISMTGYMSLCQEYIKKNYLHSVVPFEPLINRYIKECIARCDQEQTRTTILNQFAVNPLHTVQRVVEKLEPALQANRANVSTNNGAGNEQKSQSGVNALNDDTIYECFEGPVNYTRDIISTYYVSDNKRYRILTYNECLFDMLGFTSNTPKVGMNSQSPANIHNKEVLMHERALHEMRHIGDNSADEEHKNKENLDRFFENTMSCGTMLLDKLSWSERLNYLPELRARVLIKQMSGKQIKEMNINADVTVQWLDPSNISCTRTFSLKKKK